MSLNRLLVGALLSAIAVAPAQATSQRTFVSTAGVDNPTCSLVAPCRTFAAAMVATNAAGEVIVLDSGGYGAVSITQSVSIIAPASVYAGVSVLAGDGVLINGPGIQVVLRGLSINGMGGQNGIAITDAAAVRVENCTVSSMFGAGIRQLAGTLYVKDTILRRNGDSGVWSTGAVRANLDGVLMEANLDGVQVQNGAIVVARESVMTGNTRAGAYALVDAGSAASKLTIARSQLSSNAQGALAKSTQSNVQALIGLSDSVVVNNTTGVLATQQNGGLTDINAARSSIVSNGTGLNVGAGGAHVTLDGNVIAGFVLPLSNDIVLGSGSVIATRNNNTVGPVNNGGGIIATVPPF